MKTALLISAGRSISAAVLSPPFANAGPALWRPFSTGEPLKQTRSVDQAPVQGPGGFQRSVDAPAEVTENKNRDDTGASQEEIDAKVKDAVEHAGARASEALGGRVGNLREKTSVNVGGDDPNKDWSGSMVGDGIKETVKQGTQKVKDTLKQMFNPTGSGSGSVPGAGSRTTGSPAGERDREQPMSGRVE